MAANACVASPAPTPAAPLRCDDDGLKKRTKLNQELIQPAGEPSAPLQTGSLLFLSVTGEPSTRALLSPLSQASYGRGANAEFLLAVVRLRLCKIL